MSRSLRLAVLGTLLFAVCGWCAFVVVALWNSQWAHASAVTAGGICIYAITSVIAELKS